jgi:AraC-like DNA-binding protein
MKATSALIILRAEQETFETEKKLRDKQIQMHKTRNLYTLGGSLLLLILLGIGIYYNHIITRKNRGLFCQIKEQDHLANELEKMTRHYEVFEHTFVRLPSEEQAADKSPLQVLPGDKQQRQLVASLCEHLLYNRNFAKTDISRDDILAFMPTNRTTLSEAVKAVTGITLMEYIQTIRLNEAKLMLDNCTDLTIELIAEKCGFQTPATFYRLFRKYYHITPAEYRKIRNR